MTRLENRPDVVVEVHGGMEFDFHNVTEIHIDRDKIEIHTPSGIEGIFATSDCKAPWVVWPNTGEKESWLLYKQT